jgi:hypothetical protein
VLHQKVVGEEGEVPCLLTQGREVGEMGQEVVHVWMSQVVEEGLVLLSPCQCSIRDQGSR